MKYDVSESVRVERHELGGKVTRLSVEPGQQELSNDEFALLERVAPGVATPAKPARKQEK